MIDKNSSGIGPRRALLFDYDGLLVDTEVAEFRSWQQVYTNHGSILELEEWLQAVGHVDNFDPRATLENRIQRNIDWTTIDPVRSAHNLSMVACLTPLTGACELMQKGKAAGWLIGVVSNSTREWVEPGLERLGLLSMVEALCTRGDAPEVKPHPAPYLHALAMLGVEPADGIAFEDSGPGVRSALAAGLTVVAVPNAITCHHDLSAAHQVLPSLDHFDLPPLTPNAPRESL